MRPYHTACLATKLTSWLSLNRQMRLNDNIRLIISSYRGGRPLIKEIKARCVRLGRPQTRRTPERHALHTSSMSECVISRIFNYTYINTAQMNNQQECISAKVRSLVWPLFLWPWPWPWPNDPDLDILMMYVQAKNDVSRSKLS